MGGQIHLTPVLTPQKYINELRAKSYKVDEKNKPVPDNIQNLENQQKNHIQVLGLVWYLS